MFLYKLSHSWEMAIIPCSLQNILFLMRLSNYGVSLTIHIASIEVSSKNMSPTKHIKIVAIPQTKNGSTLDGHRVLTGVAEHHYARHLCERPNKTALETPFKLHLCWYDSKGFFPIYRKDTYLYISSLAAAIGPNEANSAPRREKKCLSGFIKGRDKLCEEL